MFYKKLFAKASEHTLNARFALYDGVIRTVLSPHTR